jgi:hypothetical protein
MTFEEFQAQKKASSSTQPQSGGGLSFEQWKASKTPQEPSMVSKVLNTAGDIGMGAIQGAANIGSTIMQPIDYLRDQSGQMNIDRRAGVKAGLDSLGADRESLAFKGGELGSELAGTWAAGGALSKGLKVGSYAPQLATALESAGMAKTDLIPKLVGGAISGAAQAGLIDPNSAGIGAGAGAAFPLAGKLVSGATKAAFGGNVSPEIAAGVQKAGQYGIDVPVDRILKSKPLNALAASLEYVPLSGRTEKIAQMDEQLRSALSKTMGQSDSNLGNAVDKAKKELGSKFDEYLTKAPVTMDNQFVSELMSHENLANQELLDKSPVIKNYINQLFNAVDNNGQIDTKAAYSIKKRLDALSQNKDVGFYAKQVRSSLMDALDRSLGAEDAAAFSKVRQQYQAMKSVEPMVKSGFEGELSAARLANIKPSRNAEIEDLRNIAGQFMRPRESAHSAGQRVTLGGLAGGLVGGLGGVPAVALSLAGSRGATELLSSDLARRAALSGIHPPRKLGEAVAKTAIPML